MRNSTREWIGAADSDLKVIDSSYLEEKNARIFAFMAKSAIEKSFKSVIFEYNLGLDYIHTNNLQKLMNIIADVVTFDIDIKLIETLDYIFDMSESVSTKNDKIISSNDSLLFVDLAREITQEVWELYENDESKYI